MSVAVRQRIDRVGLRGAMFGKFVLHVYSWIFTFAFASRALVYRGRGTHTVGVGAKGRFRVVDSPEFPPNEFFSPSREFPLQIRHAAALHRDEAEKDFRSIAVKLSDANLDSPFDLAMNTGIVAGFWHAPSFFLGVLGGAFGERGRKWYAVNHPPAWVNIREGNRRPPDSYTRVHYYARIVYALAANDGKNWLCRFRIVPFDIEPQSGIPVGQDYDDCWFEDRLPGEERPADYLRREFEGRLDDIVAVRYRLQGKFRAAPVETTRESEEWFNISVEWNEQSHPWLDIGILELDTPLSDLECERLRFRIQNLPAEVITLPEARSPRDYRSIGWLRAKVYPRMQALRFFGYRMRRWLGLSERPAWQPVTKPEKQHATQA